MSLKEHFTLLAAYNQSMNTKVYEAASRLDTKELTEDRGAFFGSILGTLNHILVGDIIWLKRFSTHPSCMSSLREVVNLPNPSSLDQILFEDFTALSEQRAWLDCQIICWIDELTETDLDRFISYHNSKSVPANKRFSSLVLHLFNHQTHHRGQVSALLSQAGEDIGVTDLLALIPEETRV
ncbi:DinB family protein [Photobacterium halotolerans]|uniref:Damage-inducible protein DinB n=1 Tax=Photobacterium halotolerans TaxID=265726 RepID=A0A7X4WEL2_9GAMM|nr:DinB family protein [Photobacterium halotolerans]NAW67274.1 damage-inducible protein DinB [Photobacterium halotolerans]